VSESEAGPNAEPLLRVVRGQPDEIELAAVVLALALASGRREAGDGADADGAKQQPIRATWDRPAARYRAPNSWTSTG